MFTKADTIQFLGCFLVASLFKLIIWLLIAFLQIDRAGLYHFWTESDDGSNLYVNGIQIINNDGLHGPVKKGARMMLSKNFHFIKATFFEAAGSAFLKVTYSGADTNLEEIPVPAWMPSSAPNEVSIPCTHSVSYFHAMHAHVTVVSNERCTPAATTTASRRVRSDNKRGRGRGSSRWFVSREDRSFHEGNGLWA